MSDLPCPFSAPVVKKDAACVCAQEVIRRGGAEVACQDQVAQQRCNELYLKIKAASLALMGADDDLLTLPHSVLVKVQYGGLAGLQDAGDHRRRHLPVGGPRRAGHRGCCGFRPGGREP